MIIEEIKTVLHFIFLMPNGSKVLSMRYASLAFRQIKEQVNIGQ